MRICTLVSIELAFALLLASLIILVSSAHMRAWVSTSSSGGRADEQRICNESLYECKGDYFSTRNFTEATIFSDSGQFFVVEEALFPATKNFYRGITLCSQGSFDRWNKLVQQVKNWNGPVSAALFVTTDEIAKVRELYAQEEMMRRFAVLSIVLKNDTKLPYPVNFLRNVAVSNAPTDYIITVDADFLPRPQCHQLLACVSRPPRDLVRSVPVIAHHVHSPQLNEIIKADREVATAFVLAAFEIDIGAYLNGSFPANVSDVVRMEAEGTVRQFHLKAFSSGHSPTNYSLWRQSKFNEWYEVQPTASYEPYVILNRLTMPKYDERFAKRYYNKIAQIFELQMFNYRFLVLPETFLVHVNHAKVASEQTRKQSLGLYRQFRGDMQGVESIAERRYQSFGECQGTLQNATTTKKDRIRRK